VSVVLANARLTARVREQKWLRDDTGVAYPGPFTEETRGPYPCAVNRPQPVPGERDAVDAWSLRADPRMWPLRKGDHLTDGARVWVVTGARLIAVPGAPAADWIACTATLNDPPVP
jgi:hypothetical protein